MPTQPRIGSLCSGMGGLDLAVQSVLGGQVAWHADRDSDASKVLAHHWPSTPNLGDLTVVAWDQVEPVEVLTAGYPCQPESNAGRRRSTQDERWIWPWIADAIRGLRPGLVVLENVRGHVGRGLSTVVGDLAGLGYDARWGCVRADEIGAPHRRERVFIVAHPADTGRHARPEVHEDGATAARCGGDAAHTGGAARRPGDALAGDSGTPTGQGGATQPGGCAGATADAQGDRRHEGQPEPARHVGRPDAALGRGPAADADSDPVRQQPVAELGSGREAVSGLDGVDWGAYTAAIRRWEHILGRPAPAPTVTGRHGGAVLNPALPEWMLGLPAGWVTAVPGLSRSAQLRILGNGVCPQQGALALRLLLPAA